MRKTLSFFFICCLSFIFTKCYNKPEDLPTGREIVSQIEQLDLQPETITAFRIDDFSEPASLYELPEDHMYVSGQGRGNVWAIVENGGNLNVFIETLDEGHKGEKGLAYSADQSQPNWDPDKYGEHWKLGGRVDENWWKIYWDMN